ncbi:FAD-dependent oxidoreductase [Aquabacterium sp.]|uniref:FAD-dependent oxidoreductase n=1 Tax=Aquabacterium sp. TaxID=1872578 RepID=UPI002C9C49B5|nr:FAD-dependent oxidoreductase [Aquabacterium sp.]HSW05040.1 FAD-dependent oxidoreductase [Aquabacterium sp.]
MKTVARTDERILSADVFDRDAKPPRPALGSHHEPARQIPVYRRCDVLVVGGGPSGTAAATAAARLGADVVLLERYNHLGGLSTGGLVIWIDRMSDWQGELVIRGFAEELFDRLPAEAVAGPAPTDWGSTDAAKAAHWSQRTAAYHGIVTWSPTIDPERLKLLSQEIAIESGVHLLYHAWASEPIVEQGRVAGISFESKEGRMAIRASVVVDATGDGDIFARAGAAYDNDIEEADVHHCMNTSWLFGGVDMARWIAFKAGQPELFADFMARGRTACGLFDRPFVSWRDDIALFMGPRQSGYSALDVDDLTAVEVRSHRAMDRHLAFYRAHAPGFENAYLMLSAPQIGVRHARRLKGVDAVLRSRWSEGLALPDEIGVTPAVSPKFPNISIPYGALLPQTLDGLLACGRHVSCDKNSHGFMREIPQCWITGQAAGAAAALAVARGIQPRAVDIRELQAALLNQGVFLRPATEAIAA